MYLGNIIKGYSYWGEQYMEKVRKSIADMIF